jgi:hypothetical protein
MYVISGGSMSVVMLFMLRKELFNTFMLTPHRRT